MLAERASVTKQAIGEVVSDLEGKGLVHRVPDPEDGRAKTDPTHKKRAQVDGRGLRRDR
ncbi:MAG: MarR family transcriptional regulator [Actinobacteria bacterium]|nr:MarR family transcriptional regulator [Actinomycetota bacterium]